MSLLTDVHAQVLERLGRVSVTARHAVESALAGGHRSVRRGLSVEFAGHREYQPGDDLRRLDWQVWARTDRYDVRVYEEETRLRATLVVDASGSMGYGADGSKLACARTLAAALAFLMARRSDAVGLAVIDTAVRTHRPPATTMGHVLAMIGALEQTVAGGETGLGTVIEQLGAQLGRRGLVVLLTDAYDDPERLGRSLRFLRHRRQDVRLVQIVDPDEVAFPFAGMAEFVGLEGEPPLKLDADRVRPWYQEALAEHRRRLSTACHSGGVLFDTVSTAEDPALALARILGAADRRSASGARR
jgi:uncharacterized protein (DUF58 family)